MKLIAITLLFAASLVVPGMAQDDGHGDLWFADFDKAVAAAKDSGKDLLVDFTGSDWCGWCIRLDNEVFSHDEFISAASKNYVFVALDFPRDEEIKAKVPNPARNEELMQKWGVQGFPTIMLVTAEGEPFGRTGYEAGGPENYVTHLGQIAAKGKTALADAKKLSVEYGAAADDAARLAVVERAIEKLAKMTSSDIGFTSIATVARNAFTLDAANEKGVSEKALKALLTAGVVDDDIAARVNTIDPKNAKGIREILVNAKSGMISSEEELGAAVEMIAALFELGPIKDVEIDKNLSVNMAFWHFRFLEDQEKAKHYAKRAQALVGEDQRFERLFKEILGDDDEDVDDEDDDDEEEDPEDDGGK